MSTDEPTPEDLRAQIDELESRIDDLEGDGPTSMTIIATKGTLDMAYPVLILAPMAAAFGWNVTVFATFWGLDMLHEDNHEHLRLSAVGNPSHPLPNLLAVLAGMDRVTTRMMHNKIEEVGTETVPELIHRAWRPA